MFYRGRSCFAFLRWGLVKNWGSISGCEDTKIIGLWSYYGKFWCHAFCRDAKFCVSTPWAFRCVSPQMAMFHVSTPWGTVAFPAGGLQYCGREPQYSRTSSVESVLLPLGHVVFNIIRDKIQFVHVSDEVFVVSGLPFKRELVLPRKFGDTDFKSAYHRCQIFRLWTESVVWHNDVVGLSYFSILLRFPLL